MPTRDECDPAMGRAGIENWATSFKVWPHERHGKVNDSRVKAFSECREPASPELSFPTTNLEMMNA
jgi:hypothetical protein